jgi:hypothetical protein
MPERSIRRLESEAVERHRATPGHVNAYAIGTRIAPAVLPNGARNCEANSAEREFDQDP